MAITRGKIKNEYFKLVGIVKSGGWGQTSTPEMADVYTKKPADA
jgi:hypothetical protein